MKYIKRTVSVLLLLCLLLSMVGCKSSMPNLEADEAVLVKNYVSLLGSDRSSALTALNLAEAQLTKDKYRFDVTPINATIEQQDFQLLLGFDSTSGKLNSVQFEKTYAYSEENALAIAKVVHSAAQYFTEKYDETLDIWRWEQAKDANPKPLTFTELKEEGIVEKLKEDKVNLEDRWVVTEKMPQSVQDYVNGFVESGQYDGTKVFQASAQVSINVQRYEDKMTVRIQYYGKINSGKKITLEITPIPEGEEKNFIQKALEALGLG